MRIRDAVSEARPLARGQRGCWSTGLAGSPGVRFYASCLSFLLFACSSDNPKASGLPLPHFNDIPTAPPNIQTAAEAVIRIRTAGQYGTGSFISESGLLLTNNHILGDSVCPIEGCYFEMTKQHQIGKARLQPATVFAVPLAVDVGLDMAVVQVYDQRGGAMLATPGYLLINPMTATDLLGKHVTIVGHPEGYLKKWTDGTVVDTNGKWFTCTAYTLPGDSGSPALDDQGQIVGLMHRGPTSEDLITDVGVNLYSVGTASSDLSSALSNPLPSVMLSVSAATTNEAFLRNDLVYLNARATTASIGGLGTNALTLLDNACDAVLARNDFASPNDLSSAMKPCYDAHLLIECRNDAGSKPYVTLCPDASDIAKWVTRNQAINQAWLNMNGSFDYTAISFSIAAMQTTMAAGVAAGALSLQQGVAAMAPPLDITLAYYLAAFNVSSYAATNIHDYVVNYAQVPHYELNARYVAWAASWLWGDGFMTRADLISLLKKLLDDPMTSVGDQEAIEDYLYGMDAS